MAARLLLLDLIAIIQMVITTYLLSELNAHELKGSKTYRFGSIWTKLCIKVGIIHAEYCFVADILCIIAK